MEWDNLRYILAIARAKSVAGAAMQLKVHHTTVFRRLNALEKSLGVRLFERLAKGYVLTFAGEEMYHTALEIESKITTLDRHISGQDRQLKGLIRITTTASLLRYLLTPCFAAFIKEYPEIELEILESNQQYNLTKRDADIAIRTTNNPPEHLVGHKIACAGITIYGSKNYLAANRNIDNITEHTWIGAEESLERVMYGNKLIQLLPQIEFKYRFNRLMGILSALLNDMGVGLLFCYMGNSELSLQSVRPKIPELGKDLWILTHPDIRHVARISVFVDFIAEALKSKIDLITSRD
ncbi:MAG: LysR family transcriptional regulator [Cyanobacteria bacterium J06621_15]